MLKGIKVRALVAVCVLSLVLSSFGTVMAADQNVLKEAPADDAAVVERLEGFKVYPHEGELGTLTTEEGLVIRESYIEDGKIHIPPSGLYYTQRNGTFHTNPLALNAISLLGEKYYFADYRHVQDVLTNATFESVGDRVPFGDGTKSLELTGLSMTQPGFVSPTATFMIMKPSGNYYGRSLTVNTDLQDITTGVLSEGTGRTTGTYGEAYDDEEWIQNYYLSSVDTVGATYLVADSVTTGEITVKEFATSAVDYYLLTKETPEKMTLGVDESMNIDQWSLRVLDISDNSATVRLWNAETEELMEKELGPLTSETMSRVPADQSQRRAFVLRCDSEEFQIQLDVYNDPFGEEGQVKLVAFKDLVKLSNPDTWYTDDRFTFRPDT